MSLPTIKEKIVDSSYAEDSSIPSFLKKTYDILESNSYPDIISWSEDGSLIIIKDTAELSEKVLPTFFKHKNFTSYVRQRGKKYDSESLYIRDHLPFVLFRHLLSQIKRRHTDLGGGGTSKSGTAKTEEEEDSDYEGAGDSKRQRKRRKNSREGTRMSARLEAVALEKDNITLTKLETEMTSRIDNLEAKFKKFSDQNRLLVDLIQSRE